MKPENYPTAHELARQLLAMPNIPAILLMPTFDMPGAAVALPVKPVEIEVQGVKVILLDVIQDTEPKAEVCG